MKKIQILVLLGSIFLSKMSAQVSSPDLNAFITDMVFMSKQYVSPAGTASAYQSSGAWYTSATSVGKFNVDFSLHINALFIPKNQKSFTIKNSDFNSLVIQDQSLQQAQIPTALGGDTNVFFDFFIDDNQYELQAFEGVKMNVLAHPYLQATVGLWKETDVTVRYSPRITIDASNYEIFGIALKHTLSQYFRGDKKNPIEVALLVSYSKFDLNLFFDSVNIKPVGSPSNTEPLTTLDGVIIDADSWLYQAIASKKTGNFEINASLGVTQNKFNYLLSGKEGLVLDLFNDLLVLLDQTKTHFKGDVGVNYFFKNKKWYLSSTVSIGTFANANVALHYRLF